MSRGLGLRERQALAQFRASPEEHFSIGDIVAAVLGLPPVPKGRVAGYLKGHFPEGVYRSFCRAMRSLRGKGLVLDLSRSFWPRGIRRYALPDEAKRYHERVMQTFGHHGGLSRLLLNAPALGLRPGQQEQIEHRRKGRRGRTTARVRKSAGRRRPRREART